MAYSGHVGSAAPTVVDELGVYRVTHGNSAVKAELQLASPVVARLDVGDTVVVVELVPLPEEHRIRARLAEPAGWMTLRETRTNYCWATLLQPISAERAGLISDVFARQQQLLTLEVRAERLRAEHQTHLNDFRDRAAELEARLLEAKLVFVDRPAPAPPRPPPRPAVHLEGDRELHAQLPKLPQYPPGFRVVDSQEVELDHEMRRALAAYPPPPPPPPHVHRHHGNIVISNAGLVPSRNYEGMRPDGVFPVTWPAGLLYDQELVNQVYEPFPPTEHYDSEFPGAWRYTAAGGCPLAVQRVDMVADPYGGGSHLHASPVYMAALARSAAVRG